MPRTINSVRCRRAAFYAEGSRKYGGSDGGGAAHRGPSAPIRAQRRPPDVPLCSSKWRTTPVLREERERPAGASAVDLGPGCGAAGAAAGGAAGEAAEPAEVKPRIRR